MLYTEDVMLAKIDEVILVVAIITLLLICFCFIF